MRRPRRVSFGETRYPAQKSEAAAHKPDYIPDCTLDWFFAERHLSDAFDNLINLKTGFAEKEKSHKLPLQTEKEAHNHLRKVWIQDLALQKATKRLSYPYRREKSVAEEIKEFKTEQISLKKEIEAGLTVKDLPRISYDDPDWVKNCVKHLRFSSLPSGKNIDDLSQDIEIAAEIEASLLKEIPKNHPEVTAEVKRIKVLIKADPTLENWSEFLNKVFGPKRHQ